MSMSSNQPPAAAGEEVPALVWSDAFLLGYTPMDHMHEEFVQVVQHLRTCTDDEVPSALEAVIAHLEQHFGEENRWMRETEFPARDCHIDEHAAVMKSAYEVKELVEQGERWIPRDFARELARWFPGHADYLDSALAHWMFKRQHAGKPIVLRRDLALR